MTSEQEKRREGREYALSVRFILTLINSVYGGNPMLIYDSRKRATVRCTEQTKEGRMFRDRYPDVPRQHTLTALRYYAEQRAEFLTEASIDKTKLH